MFMRIVIFLILLLIFFVSSKDAIASYDPISRTNNIFGIHILFTSELEHAAKLVNSSGGDWGYVTIPIQYGDRNLEKWQKFMDDAAHWHLIPIVRVATEPYYANTAVWRKPNDFDIVDFANFLNSLTWPTKNRYVLLFNEVNRYDEWGGEPPDPAAYADFVSYAVDAFHERNQDFFVIAGGLDNASPNDGVKYRDNFVFLNKMAEHNPEVFAKIDGFASHSYPNPNFAEPPSKNRQEGTSTYKYEVEQVEKFARKQVPVFITETGWNADVLPDSVVSSYFKVAMNDIWGQDARVIAVTPFILESNGGPFDKFTFFKNGNLTSYGLSYQSLPKKRGDPVTVERQNLIALQNTSKPSFKFGFISIPEIKFDSIVLRSFAKIVLAMEK